VAENIPTLDEWSKLYEAASRVKELAPFKLKQSPTLPSLESAKEFLLRGFM
jgi:hypothetical protein